MKNRSYLNPFTGKIADERRSRHDRRTPASLLALFGDSPRRRKSRGRRKTDQGAYVDSYDAQTLSIATAVLILSLVDAVLTRMHLVRGTAHELNPLMNGVIDHGGLTAFFAIKAAMTIFPMLIIVIHKEWAWGRYAARICLVSYILLSFYHLYLFIGVHRIASLLTVSHA
jgi:hypothetical protein